uniref:EDR1/CTR1/ARMC3-like peptidase-like domain-containing protein n=1 Tax=Cannabis sativa TaxID=3483 RepID=A0A803QVH2_CANSA
MASGTGTCFDFDVYHDYSEMTSFNKSRALQTQESYQLQLALALRLSSQAALADHPNFLDFKSQSHDQDVESLAHRFWVNGCLSYSDKIPDGFYLIDGLDPYAWNLSTDPNDSGRIPSLETLKAIRPRNESSVKVVAVDKLRDSGLMELQNWVLRLSSTWFTTVDVIYQLANLVCNRMGFWLTWLTYLVELLRGANTVVRILLPPALCNLILKRNMWLICLRCQEFLASQTLL